MFLRIRLFVWIDFSKSRPQGPPTISKGCDFHQPFASGLGSYMDCTYWTSIPPRPEVDPNEKSTGPHLPKGRDFPFDFSFGRLFARTFPRSTFLATHFTASAPPSFWHCSLRLIISPPPCSSSSSTTSSIHRLLIKPRPDLISPHQTLIVTTFVTTQSIDSVDFQLLWAWYVTPVTEPALNESHVGSLRFSHYQKRSTSSTWCPVNTTRTASSARQNALSLTEPPLTSVSLGLSYSKIRRSTSYNGCWVVTIRPASRPPQRVTR